MRKTQEKEPIEARPLNYHRIYIHHCKKVVCAIGYHTTKSNYDQICLRNMNNLEIILNLCHLTMNPIHSLLQRRHSRVPGFIPNKPAPTTEPPNPHHTTTNHQKQITVSSPTNLVKYESTGTPSTVKVLVTAPDTLSRSSICRLILCDTPSTKLFDCTHTQNRSSSVNKQTINDL